jgi:hypothetical protein
MELQIILDRKNEDLSQLFHRYGDCNVLSNENNVFNVKYKNEQDGRDALEGLDNKLFKCVKMTVLPKLIPVDKELSDKKELSVMDTFSFTYSDVKQILSSIGVHQIKMNEIVNDYILDNIHQKTIDLMKIKNMYEEDAFINSLDHVELTKDQMHQLWHIFTKEQMLEIYMKELK